MPDISNVFRLFISPTFADFQAEREALRRNMFPLFTSLAPRAALAFLLPIYDGA
jgi:hypothetical protein